jgi:ElaB/YqjD/DUF883 family membrane-anchored ribosome-binding protein
MNTPETSPRTVPGDAPAHDPRGPAATGDYAARGKSPVDIERDIDHTRAEMSETLDAIGARFQPDYIKEQAKDALRSTARDAGSTMLDTVRDNPVPAIIAGLSIGWLVAKGGESERDRYHRERYEDDYYRRYGRYPAPRTRYRAGYRTGYDDRYGAYDYDEHERSSGDRSVTDRAGDKAAQAKDKAGDLADRATDRAQDFADDARHYGRRAENWLERQMNESPLAMGAVALAAGALVGLAVPETRKEDEWMGRPSDRLKHQAKQAAEEKLDQAKRVAEATAEEAKDKAKDVAEDAKDEAKDLAESAKQEAKKQDLDEPPKTVSTSASTASPSSNPS